MTEWRDRRRRTAGGYHDRNHHSAKWASGHFVAWDGEGAEAPRKSDGKPSPQPYVYLATYDGVTGHEADLVNVDSIPTRDALGFLTREAGIAGKDATHVCYGMSYDANQILKDLSRDACRHLLAGERVRYHQFTVAYRPRKSLWAQDRTTGNALTLWDVFGFDQTSFIHAVEKRLGFDDARLPNIRKGKARRGNFRVSDLPFIRRYTHDELTALTDLCSRLRDSFDALGWKLRRWDGAGAAAAALLAHEGMKRHLDGRISDEVHAASLSTYAGGRIEPLRYGFVEDTIYHADQRSAYPSQFEKMPSLRRGRWRHIEGESTEPFSMSHVRYDFRRLGADWPLLPFKHRENRAIYFPQEGSTWVWRSELESALRWDDLRRKIHIDDSWEFIPDEPNDRPFAWMRRWYNERRRMKREGRREEYAVKLALNSAYGKTAQNVGGFFRKDGTFVPPPYHQLEYASFITAGTRAAMFDALAPVRRSAIMVQTDGVFALEPFRNITVGEELGEWEVSLGDAILVAQSGVYWGRSRSSSRSCPECRSRLDDGPLESVRCSNPTCNWSNLVHHFRGFDEESLDPDDILRAWREGRTTVEGSSHRFVTMAYASLHESTWPFWRCWLDEPRSLDICATGKRMDYYPPPWRGNHNPSKELLPTLPATTFVRESEPYDLAFAKNAGEESHDAQEQVAL